MKKLQFLFLFLLLLPLFVFVTGGRRPGNAQMESFAQEEYVPNEVLVRFKKDVGKILIQQGIELVQGKIITYGKREISMLE
jgi:hypothetical protein